MWLKVVSVETSSAGGLPCIAILKEWSTSIGLERNLFFSRRRRGCPPALRYSSPRVKAQELPGRVTTWAWGKEREKGRRELENKAKDWWSRERERAVVVRRGSRKEVHRCEVRLIDWFNDEFATLTDQNVPTYYYCCTISCLHTTYIHSRNFEDEPVDSWSTDD